jgi:hypothetical protein
LLTVDENVFVSATVCAPCGGESFSVVGGCCWRLRMIEEKGQAGFAGMDKPA